jgi:hypothetical protein
LPLPQAARERAASTRRRRHEDVKGRRRICGPLLFKSMRTLDVNENRGYLLVREGTGTK